ncbi:hypothetical protein EV146_102446 [Mesobacillus foraminis]|uniref:Uncharacterized protein n=1 Tax=Mesobacillus foraminis TaxID=279826 RepID=A0A4R2BLS1_9BACI|nr:hypothetical protein EV146_102446 [Mesobacillus foraminis]
MDGLDAELAKCEHNTKLQVQVIHVGRKISFFFFVSCIDSAKYHAFNGPAEYNLIGIKSISLCFR